MTAEVRYWCQHCQKELPPSHTGPCPHCGGKNRKLVAVSKRETVGIKDHSMVIHKTLRILSPTLLVLLLLSLINLGTDILHLTGWLKSALPVIVFSVLLIVYFFQGRRVMRLKQWLERKFGVKKTIK